jgi:phage tail protein X
VIRVSVTYLDRKASVETFSILTYLRGDGYWQFLTPEGVTINIPDHAVQRIEIQPIPNAEPA